MRVREPWARGEDRKPEAAYVRCWRRGCREVWLLADDQPWVLDYYHLSKRQTGQAARYGSKKSLLKND